MTKQPTKNVQEERQTQIMDMGNKIARNTVAVIDTILQRGAFKGEEISTIGSLRDSCVQLVSIIETANQEAASK